MQRLASLVSSCHSFIIVGSTLQRTERPFQLAIVDYLAKKRCPGMERKVTNKLPPPKCLMLTWTSTNRHTWQAVGKKSMYIYMWACTHTYTAHFTGLNEPAMHIFEYHSEKEKTRRKVGINFGQNRPRPPGPVSFNRELLHSGNENCRNKQWKWQVMMLIVSGQ